MILCRIIPSHRLATTGSYVLNQEQKRMNREYALIRMVAELALAALKHFRGLADVFRQAMPLYDTAFGAVAPIICPRYPGLAHGRSPPAHASPPCTYGTPGRATLLV